MVSLLGGNADPVVEKRTRQVLTREPRDEIPAEVDSIELDMSEGVNQGDPAGHRAERPALRHLPGRTKQGVSGPGGRGGGGRPPPPPHPPPPFFPGAGGGAPRPRRGGGAGGGEPRRRLAG